MSAGYASVNSCALSENALEAMPFKKFIVAYERNMPINMNRVCWHKL